jgi:hypothetical protein
MKTPETLNTKDRGIFLRFPTNICASFGDKQSNGYGQWKTTQGKNFDQNSETDLSFRRRTTLLFEGRNKITDWMKGEIFATILD